MKYLSDYTDQEQTNLFNECGSFFAFSNRQFMEAKKEGIVYVDMGAGLLCPKENVKTIIEGLYSINIKGIALDMKENGKKAIIHRELANHECQITQSINACVEKLENYPITTCEILNEYDEFFQKCVDNDYF